jgi:hypothetical protein
VGVEHFERHLAGVVMLMKASSNYAEFKRALDRAAPKRRGLEANKDADE